MISCICTTVATSTSPSTRKQRPSADFKISRVEGERLIRASTSVQDGPAHEELIGLPNDALPIALSDALRNLGRDRVYEQSIKWVASWK